MWIIGRCTYSKLHVYIRELYVWVFICIQVIIAFEIQKNLCRSSDLHSTEILCEGVHRGLVFWIIPLHSFNLKSWTLYRCLTQLEECPSFQTQLYKHLFVFVHMEKINNIYRYMSIVRAIEFEFSCGPDKQGAQTVLHQRLFGVRSDWYRDSSAPDPTERPTRLCELRTAQHYKRPRTSPCPPPSLSVKQNWMNATQHR